MNTGVPSAFRDDGCRPNPHRSWCVNTSHDVCQRAEHRGGVPPRCGRGAPGWRGVPQRSRAAAGVTAVAARRHQGFAPGPARHPPARSNEYVEGRRRSGSIEVTELHRSGDHARRIIGHIEAKKPPPLPRAQGGHGRCRSPRRAGSTAAAWLRVKGEASPCGGRVVPSGPQVDLHRPVLRTYEMSVDSTPRCVFSWTIPHGQPVKIGHEQGPGRRRILVQVTSVTEPANARCAGGRPRERLQLDGSASSRLRKGATARRGRGRGRGPVRFPGTRSDHRRPRQTGRRATQPSGTRTPAAQATTRPRRPKSPTPSPSASPTTGTTVSVGRGRGRHPRPSSTPRRPRPTGLREPGCNLPGNSSPPSARSIPARPAAAGSTTIKTYSPILQPQARRQQLALIADTEQRRVRRRPASTRPSRPSS